MIHIVKSKIYWTWGWGGLRLHLFAFERITKILAQKAEQFSFTQVILSIHGEQTILNCSFIILYIIILSKHKVCLWIAEPSTPGQPVINDVQIDSVSFSFKKPENENGVIANQEIEYTFKPYNVCSTDEFIKEQTENMMPAIKINTTNKQFSASLKNLKSYWKYTIRVRVSTYAGFSSYSSKTIIQTLPTSE